METLPTLSKDDVVGEEITLRDHLGLPEQLGPDSWLIADKGGHDAG